MCVSIQESVSEGVCPYMKSLRCVHTGYDWKLCVHTRECAGGWVSIHEKPSMCPYRIGLEMVCPYNRE